MPLPTDMVEVHKFPNQIDITLGDKINREVGQSEAVGDCILGFLGAHFTHKWYGETSVAAMMATSYKGRTNDVDDES